MEIHFDQEKLKCWILKWEDLGLFSPSSSGEEYTVYLPPPNITGKLHMGHALNMIVQDVFARYKRTNGFSVLFCPGFDHAGIAGQIVIKRKAASFYGCSESEITAKDFHEYASIWKEECCAKMRKQIRSLGISCYWPSERFTLSDEFTNAVNQSFVSLYKKGLIYRDSYMVYWDPIICTALSDLEVDLQEKDGSFFYLKYFLEGSSTEYIEVATTRPETLFGDVAIAVHPEDARYSKYKGCSFQVPFLDKSVPLVFDEEILIEQGSGAVKITPAHDFFDFDLGKKHGFLPVAVFGKEMISYSWLPSQFSGLSPQDLRKKTILALKRDGFISFVENKKVLYPLGDRSQAVLEPILTKQWFLKTDSNLVTKCTLKFIQERIDIFPDRYRKSVEKWLDNTQPWCLSRQIMWGHRLPVWYDDDHNSFVACSEEEAHIEAFNHHGKNVSLRRETDVLDTWYSSSLWMLVPSKKYPRLSTNLLVTACDILYFWVIRMVMQSFLQSKNLAPFEEVLVHGLVVDEHGHKMSKTKGNVIDPFVMIEKYGADALRLSFLSMPIYNQVISFSEDSVRTSRNFITKLYNVARFIHREQNGSFKECDKNFLKCSDLSIIDHWILSKFQSFARDLQHSIESYEIAKATKDFMFFVRSYLCDNYLEFYKKSKKEKSFFVFCKVFKELVHRSHCFIPFITEEIWSILQDKNKDILYLCNTTVSELDIPFNEDKARIFESIIAIKSFILSLRNVCTRDKRESIYVAFLDSDFNDEIRSVYATLSHLCVLNDQIVFVSNLTKGCILFSHSGIQIGIKLAYPCGALKYISQEIDRIDRDIKKFNDKLMNGGFIANAPSSVVEKTKEQRRSLVDKYDLLERWKQDLLDMQENN